VAFSLVGSAVLLGAVAVWAFTGMLPLDDEVRGIVGTALTVAAVLDLALAFWFFRSPPSR
jgi:hypothetical protein